MNHRQFSSGVTRVIRATALCLISAAASAGDTDGAYDRQSTIALSGVLSEFEWADPHVYLYVDVESEEGDDIVWEIQGPSPSLMTRFGWSAESLERGNRVMVLANPHRNPSRREALGVSISMGAGRTMLLYGRPTPGIDPPKSAAARAVIGRWLPQRNASVEQFVSGASAWALTEKGRAALASDADGQGLCSDCVSPTAPYSMLWWGLRVIELRDDVLVIRGASNDDFERTVHMRVDSHDRAPYTSQGHSIGWWEYDVLVVDTARFADHKAGNAPGLPSGPHKRLRERFELSGDRTSLMYSFVLEDPDYFTEPVRGHAEWLHRPDL